MLNNRIEDDDDNAALAATADVIEKAYLTHLKSDATRRRRFLDKFIELCDSSDIAYINERVDGFKRDFVCLLPLELVEKILGYLDWRDVLNCCSVSSLWNRTISQSFDNMWLKFIVDNIPLNESSLSNHQTDLNLKDLFVKLMNQKTRLETGKLFRTSKIDLVDINAIGLYKNIVCTGKIYFYRNKIMIFKLASKLSQSYCKILEIRRASEQHRRHRSNQILAVLQKHSIDITRCQS